MKFDAYGLSGLSPEEFGIIADRWYEKGVQWRALRWRKARWCAFGVAAACGLAFVFFVAPVLG